LVSPVKAVVYVAPVGLTLATVGVWEEPVYVEPLNVTAERASGLIVHDPVTEPV
jgi:hypothetical protein